MTAYLWRHEIRRAPLDVPLTLVQSTTVHRTFTVDRSSRYDIRVEVARALPEARLDQILGARGAESSELDIDWSIQRNGAVEATGTRDTYPWNHSSGSTTRARVIGTFRAEPGAPYELSVRVKRTIPEQAELRPRLQVSIDWPSNKGVLMNQGLLLLARNVALAAAACCAAFNTYGAVLQRWRARQVMTS
ncbi:MAG TPA: hypothetical protein VGS03_07055 [Candidatus Polarisedimenticolia bacterium]|jgi:hypothetical protein|nr:hypothetical protein [Candidatus Polarisedimenticolia bacterium]